MLFTVRAGWEYRSTELPPSLPLQRAVSLYKADGRGDVGKQAPPSSLSLCLSVCQVLLYSVTPLFSLFSLFLSLLSLYSLNQSVFLLSFCSCAYISLFSVSSRSFSEVTRRSWLTKPIVLFQLWHCNCSLAAIYGHFCYHSVMLWKPIPTRKRKRWIDEMSGMTNMKKWLILMQLCQENMFV